jgi:hypothetical protein
MFAMIWDERGIRMCGFGLPRYRFGERQVLGRLIVIVLCRGCRGIRPEEYTCRVSQGIHLDRWYVSHHQHTAQHIEQRAYSRDMVSHHLNPLQKVHS